VKYYSLPTLEEAGLLKFKELVFDKVKNDVTAAVLALVNEERDGSTIEQDMVKQTINLYIEMGMDRLDVYVVCYAIVLASLLVCDVSCPSIAACSHSPTPHDV
jgi:hypothetical protein